MQHGTKQRQMYLTVAVSEQICNKQNSNLLPLIILCSRGMRLCILTIPSILISVGALQIFSFSTKNMKMLKAVTLDTKHPYSLQEMIYGAKHILLGKGMGLLNI